MIVVRKVLTQDTQDILSDTELSTIPGLGTLEIYGASSVADTNIFITYAGSLLVKNRPLKQSTSGVIDTLQDEPFSLQVDQGQKVSIDVDFNTAGTATILVVYKTPEEI